MTPTVAPAQDQRSAVRLPDSRRTYQRGRILAALAQQALTAQQLADRLHLTRDGINMILAGMKAETPRLVHVAGFAPNPTGGPAAPLYRPGDRKDAKYTRSRAPKGRITAADRRSNILKLLSVQPLTVVRLKDKTGLRRVGVYVTALHAEQAIHIQTWEPNPAAGYPSPVYAVGNAPDAPRPAAQSDHEKNARHWAKLKADPERHAAHLRMNRLRKRPQTWCSALM